MQHKNFKLDFYSPFFQEKNNDTALPRIHNKTSSPFDFYMSYHKSDPKSTFMKRELGISLLFENAEMLKPIRNKHIEILPKGKPLLDKESPDPKGNRRILNPETYETSRSIPLRLGSYIKSFGDNNENYQIFDGGKKNMYIERNRRDVIFNRANKYGKQRKSHKQEAKMTLDNFLKLQKEFYFENPEMKEWAKEANIEEEIEDVKKARVKKHINKIFLDMNLDTKDKKLIFKQLLFEFHPDKNFHEPQFSSDIFNYLQENKKFFGVN